MGRRLSKTVMLTDPVSGRGLTLLAGTVPEPHLAAVIGTHAFEAGEDEGAPSAPEGGISQELAQEMLDALEAARSAIVGYCETRGVDALAFESPAAALEAVAVLDAETLAALEEAAAELQSLQEAAAAAQTPAPDEEGQVPAEAGDPTLDLGTEAPAPVEDPEPQAEGGRRKGRTSKPAPDGKDQSDTGDDADQTSAQS